MQDVVQNMRANDVRVNIREGDVFTVAFYGENPRTVKNVAERLATLFIEESRPGSRDRRRTVTTNFLESTVEEAKRRLAEHEKKLEDYRTAHSGRVALAARAEPAEHVADDDADSANQPVAQPGSRTAALRREAVEGAGK